MAALALIFSDETRIDMRFVCPRDVKKMQDLGAKGSISILWPAKHECEELKEGVWLEPVPAKESEGIGLQSIAMWPGRSSWKEGGRNRDFSILAGRMLVNV